LSEICQKKFNVMATFTILIQDQKKNGLYPIYIRVYLNNKSANIHTNMYASPKQLTKDLKLKDPFIVREISNRIARYEEIKRDIGFNLSAYTAKELADYLIRKTTTTMRTY